MSSKISVGQEQPSLLQDPNTPIIETKSKASQNTMEKIVVSDILRSATRNQHNTTSEQYATVLAPRTDGSIYSGVITFTASEPVRIEIQHPINLDNKTVNDKQLQGIIKYSNNQPISASLIAPNYSDDRFSSSIFFTGKALEFAYEKPFVAMYTVSAVADKSNNTEGPANTTKMEALEPPMGYQVNSGTLLTAVIPQLSNEILQELPFSDLDPADLSLIIRKVPPDKAGIIISKLPTDQREEILSKIPADKRQEIVKNLTKQ
jgi:MgtE intracellular N domain